MDESNFIDLAKARIDRAKQLIGDAELLLESESYASANNRAYYALEKLVMRYLPVKRYPLNRIGELFPSLINIL